MGVAANWIYWLDMARRHSCAAIRVAFPTYAQLCTYAIVSMEASYS